MLDLLKNVRHFPPYARTVEDYNLILIYILGYFKAGEKECYSE